MPPKYSRIHILIDNSGKIIGTPFCNAEYIHYSDSRNYNTYDHGDMTDCVTNDVLDDIHDYSHVYSFANDRENDLENDRYNYENSDVLKLKHFHVN